eukprot:365327-Chlamydomonas_euryale.AAC.7
MACAVVLPMAADSSPSSFVHQLLQTAAASTPPTTPSTLFLSGSLVRTRPLFCRFLTSAASTAADAHKPRIDEKDLLFIVRKEPAKFARMRELLTMRTLISEARKAMDAPLDEVADAAAATAPGAGAHPPG